MVEQVMGLGFAFHHLHASRQGAGTPGSNWHQDYEQEPQTNRSHIMVHVFYYFNGLNGEVGDLVVLPRTQNTVIANGALGHLGQQVLPGEIVVDDLPPGSAVIVYSALWHARRAKPGGEDRVRYFADASYCQAGVKWPSYHSAQWREILATAREKLGHESLFAEEHFFDVREAKAAWRERQGSLVLDLAAD
jgi:ectoine hydroxylase-related dioxygenase (phytanoyl-CoA dioxygenase family)